MLSLPLFLLIITSLLVSSVMADIADSSSLFNNKKEETYKNSFFDETCIEMANEKPSKCINDAETMDKICKKACMDKQPYYKSTKYDDDGSFFDLNAKRWNGSNLDFERFIGFITAVINVPVSCEEGEREKLARDFKRLLKITPKQSIEFVVFPIVSNDERNGKECADFSEVFTTAGGKSGNVHMMETANVNGPDTHPVYQYLKDVVGLEEIMNDLSTLMFVNPMASQIDVLEGQSYDKVKKYSTEHLQTWEL